MFCSHSELVGGCSSPTGSNGSFRTFPHPSSPHRPACQDTARSPQLLIYLGEKWLRCHPGENRMETTGQAHTRNRSGCFPEQYRGILANTLWSAHQVHFSRANIKMTFLPEHKCCEFKNSFFLHGRQRGLFPANSLCSFFAFTTILLD